MVTRQTRCPSQRQKSPTKVYLVGAGVKGLASEYKTEESDMDEERDLLWREAARLCKEWLDAKEEYDSLVRKYYPFTNEGLIELPSNEDLVQETDAARERETQAHSRHREAYFKALGAHD